jgi:hypothetical protein
MKRQPLPGVERRQVHVSQHDLSLMRGRGDPLDFHEGRDRLGVTGREGVLIDVPKVQGHNRQQNDEQGRKKRRGRPPGPRGW